MSEFSHAPTESPERRAASLAASRTSGRTPFTCQGTYLMLTPRLGFGQVGISTAWARPDLIVLSLPDFLRITVKSELIRARFGSDISPQCRGRRDVCGSAPSPRLPGEVRRPGGRLT